MQLAVTGDAAINCTCLEHQRRSGVAVSSFVDALYVAAACWWLSFIHSLGCLHVYMYCRCPWVLSGCGIKMAV